MLIPIINAVILGVVEGITEFLPISSTGHLILINQWITFGDSFTKMFDVVIQLGAILAVIIYFWAKLWPFGKAHLSTMDLPVGGEVSTRSEVLNTWKKTIVGVIPAILIGGLLGSFIENKLFSPWVVAGALIVGGVILIYIERKQIGVRFRSVAEISYMTAFYIGLIQCLSMVPGTSRAAATIIGAMVLGASRSAAVEFSFFLAIPTMIAASGYSLLKHGASISGSEIVLLLIGFVTAFIVSFVVIRFMMKFIQNHDFKPFGYYRIILGILVLIYFWLAR